MKLRINYKNLAAEFVVVVIGVAVALAADNWREEFGERRTEAEYLTRIKSELEFGLSRLEGYSDRYSAALNSTSFLINYLEGNNSLVDEPLLVEHFAIATQTNGPVPGVGISHNTVYLELISTGRLSLISDTNLREALSNYYRDMDSLSANLGALPTNIWARFRELTGKESAQYLFAGELPMGESARRLVDELDGGDQRLVREFRLLNARLNLHTRSLERNMADNIRLVRMLDFELREGET